MPENRFVREALAPVEELIRAGSYEAAERQLTELSKSPLAGLGIESVVRLAGLLRRRDGAEAAVDCYTGFLAEYPEDVRVLYHRAELYFEQHRRALCAADLNRCLALQPGSMKARRLLLDCYVENYGYTGAGKKDPVYVQLRNPAWAERLFRKLQPEEQGRLRKLKLLLDLCGGPMEWTTDGLLAAKDAAEEGGDSTLLLELLTWLAGRDDGRHVEAQGVRFLKQREYDLAHRCFCLLGKGTEEPERGCGIWTEAGRYMDSFCLRHIEKHCSDRWDKEIHGVFYIGMDRVRKLLDRLEEAPAVRSGDCLCHAIYCPGAGYQGGRSGDHHILNWVIVVVDLNDNRIVTAYPGDRTEYEKGGAA